MTARTLTTGLVGALAPTSTGTRPLAPRTGETDGPPAS